MPRVPRGLNQDQVIRALVLSGGVEEPNRGKGSHRLVWMPGARRPVIVPRNINTGLLSGIIKQAGLTLDQFLEVL
jgi:predicted RNA binding protein YcfA (HicA-like mRNA interferase family)